MRADTGITVDVWAAWAAPNGDPGRAVVGCFGFPLDTWADDMRGIAIDGLRASMRGEALSLEPGLGLAVLGSDQGVAMTSERFVRDGDASGHVLARTFLGFVREPVHAGSTRAQSKLEGCFALCAPTTDDCEEALAHAVPPLMLPPPPATLLVRGAVALLHHSHMVAIGAVTLFLCMGVLAVVTRPRPLRK